MGTAFLPPVVLKTTNFVPSSPQNLLPVCPAYAPCDFKATASPPQEQQQKSIRITSEPIRPTSSSSSPSSVSLVPPDAIAYFAYFSNLNPRKIGPTSSLPLRRFPIHLTEKAILPSHSLIYNAPGLPPFEPLFANVKSHASSEVHGVIHWVSPADFEKLSRSEAVTSFTEYNGNNPFWIVRVIDIQVKTDTGKPVMAKTFQFRGLPKAVIDLQNLCPSKRYVMVGIEGAKYWKLDNHYIQNVLEKIEYGSGLYSLVTEPRPHILDRPNPTEAFGRSSSEIYSPYRAIRAREAVKEFETSEDDHNKNTEDTEKKNRIRLIQVSQPKDGENIEEKQGLYFIPGIDGQGKSILSQVYDIEQEGIYNIKSFVYPYDNRESLSSLTETILQQIIDDNLKNKSNGVNDNGSNNKPVTIIAESMGGVLAILLSLENVKRQKDFPNDQSKTIDIDLLLLINPATSYNRSSPKALWDFLFSLNLSEDAYKLLLPPVLLPFLLDFGSTITGFAPELASRYTQVLTSLNKLSDALPKSAMEYRLNMLSNLKITDEELKSLGDDSVIGKPKRVAQICAMNDLLIPSFEESYRLQRRIPSIYTTVLPFGGHGPFFDPRFSLASYIRPFSVMSEREKEQREENDMNSKASGNALEERVHKRRDALRKRYAPTEEERENMEKPLSFAKIGKLTSYTKPSFDIYAPVFIGEENIPSKDNNRPVLFVGNHTLLGWLDALLPMTRILEKKGVVLRTLAHPLLFRTGMISFPGFDSSTSGKTTTDDMRDYGVTETNPNALLKLLSRNEWGLLFPGGAEDALKQKDDERYRVLWPEDPEFVRACALFNAIIIPLSTVGSEDSSTILLNSSEFGKVIQTITDVTGKLPLPIEGDMNEVPLDDARKWKGDSLKKAVIPPLIVPTGKNDRIYFKFGKPISVDTICAEDKVEAKKVYDKVESELREGVSVLLQRRLKDEFRGKERRERFRKVYGDDVKPPAGRAWSWMVGEDSYLDEDFQPPL